MKPKYLLYFGGTIPVIFWMTTIICGFLWGDYNHFSRMVSELGSIGTKSQYVFLTGLLLCSILSILFVIGLFKSCKIMKISTIPALIILSFSLSIGGAALFPLPLKWHGILGSPSVMLIFSPLLSLLLWNEKKQISDIKQMAILSLVIMSLGFLAYFPGVFGNFAGLKQRFFHMGWSIWFVYLSFRFTKLLDNKTSENKSTVIP